MNKKHTNDLVHELQQSKDICDFFKTNNNELTDYTLPQYLKKLLTDKNMTKSAVIKNSGLNQVYAYHIFSGEKNPSRRKVIAIAIGFKLTLNETQYLLKYANEKEIYIRNKWDSLIIFALKNHLNIMDTNQLLNDFSEPILE